MLCSIEGPDGVSKSTQAKLLGEALGKVMDKPVVVTREPGGSLGANKLREILFQKDVYDWDQQTDILLFVSARDDHVNKVIRPTLEKGGIVICDRYIDSTRVYQSLNPDTLTVDTRKRALINHLHTLMKHPDPDLTFILDLDPEVAFRRAAARRGNEDRWEKLGVKYQAALRRDFLALARDERNEDRCHVIPIEEDHSIERVSYVLSSIAQAWFQIDRTN